MTCKTPTGWDLRLRRSGAISVVLGDLDFAPRAQIGSGLSLFSGREGKS